MWQYFAPRVFSLGMFAAAAAFGCSCDQPKVSKPVTQLSMSRIQDVTYEVALAFQTGGTDARKIVSDLAREHGVGYFRPEPGARLYVNCNSRTWTSPTRNPRVFATIVVIETGTRGATAVGKDFGGDFREVPISEIPNGSGDFWSPDGE